MKIDEVFKSAIEHHKAGNLQQAEHIYKKILKDHPDNADALHFLGIIYYQLGNYDHAIEYFKKALQFNPANADAHYNLGITFQEKGQIDEAIMCFQKTTDLDPNFAMAYCNLGVALQEEKGQLNEAISCYQKALQLDPELVDAHLNMSLLLLLRGNFEEGWKEYEWRWKLKDFYRRSFSQPSWDGYDIKGLTILLYAEQGLGDTIQYTLCSFGCTARCKSNCRMPERLNNFT
jgi:tetratricopeptide (TPR) repeat protein